MHVMSEPTSEAHEEETNIKKKVAVVVRGKKKRKEEEKKKPNHHIRGFQKFHRVVRVIFGGRGQ
jgi:hypothetical protein